MPAILLHEFSDSIHRKMLTIRNAAPADAPAIWAILEPVIRAGETYALSRAWTEEQSLAFWLSPHHEVFVALDYDAVVGTYFLRPNAAGGGSHVANCGYMVASNASGKGVARAMCMHSMSHARKRGFRAIQFNFVVSNNSRAVRLWESCGFTIVGTLPDAFHHPEAGYVDAYVMFRKLDGGAATA